MKNARCRFGGALAAVGLVAVASAADFDVVALVDSLDFAKVYDIETATGTVQTLEHVLLTHANDIWWRDKGGGRMRYPSRCEMWQFSEAPFDKKRLPSEDIYGYLRLESPRGNEFPLVREECRRRGLGFGIHTTIEENHWYSPLASNWTLAHPEFWSCTRGGEPWMGCCSILFPEVVAQHGDVVRDAEDLIHLVGYVDDASAAFLQHADHIEQFVDLLVGDGGGGLVHDADYPDILVDILVFRSP